jgi:uroporphyrinogen-III synthase
MRRIAVLRPEPGNEATAARVEAIGLEAVRLPLFDVVPLPWSAPEPEQFDALLLTSANAVRVAGDRLALFRSLPVLAVGRATADAARLAGLEVMLTGRSDAASLIDQAERSGKSRMLHLGGRDRTVDRGGPVAQVIAVYASEPVPISADRLRALQASVALLHSARAALRLGELLAAHGQPREAIGIAAFSAAVAKVAGAGWASIAIAAAPSDTALIEAACARD